MWNRDVSSVEMFSCLCGMGTQKWAFLLFMNELGDGNCCTDSIHKFLYTPFLNLQYYGIVIIMLHFRQDEKGETLKVNAWTTQVSDSQPVSLRGFP